MQTLGLTLDLFDQADRGFEAYEWLVTPNADIGQLSPLLLLQQDKAGELLQLTQDHLSHSDPGPQPGAPPQSIADR
jgi:uncharacterized protein (DUF2384 family)